MKYRIRVISDYATCWGIVEADTEAAAELKIAEIEEGSR
jgi:hypothetical protein